MSVILENGSSTTGKENDMTATSVATGISPAPGFGEWLRRQRMNRHVQMQDLADEARISRTVLTGLEHERYPLTLGVAVNLAEALEVDLGYLLYKAGVELGMSGVEIERLNRLERAVDAFAASDPVVREAISSAIEKLMAEDENDPLLAMLGRALAAHDLVLIRLREEGYFTAPRARAARPKRPRLRPKKIRPKFWTENEEKFLRENPQLSNREVAEHLNRTPDAIRARRAKLTEDEKGGVR